jgi:2,3-bisphosphoglycerate-independent phosphoglycerate mutase
MSQDKFKGLVVILDGLGDRPCAKLGNKTPLEHARTPVLDSIAEHNQSGMMNPLLPGLPVETHTGVSMIFGLPPMIAASLKRGPIEASGIDLDLKPGDLLFRANLATIENIDDHNFRILDRRAQRIEQGVDALCRSLQDIPLQDDIFASLYPATHHRCVLRLRGPGLSDNITDTDPGGKEMQRGILLAEADLEQDPSSKRTASAINQFTQISHRILNNHPVNIKRVENGALPANGILTRGVGQYQNYRNILSYLRLNVTVVGGEATILGLAKLFNFNTVTDPSFTSSTDTNIKEKFSAAVAALKTSDLVFVHLKGTDIAAHDRDPQAKSDFIARFDEALGEIDIDNIVLGICADHSTDSNRGEHNGDAVPVLIHNPMGRKDLNRKFNETACSAGAFTNLTAQGFITSVLDAMGSLSNFKPSEIEFFELNR